MPFSRIGTDNRLTLFAMETELDPLKLLTPVQVAKKFQLSVRTVRFHAQVGEIPAVRIGRSWRFRPADLATYIERHRNGH